MFKPMQSIQQEQAKAEQKILDIKDIANDICNHFMHKGATVSIEDYNYLRDLIYKII